MHPHRQSGSVRSINDIPHELLADVSTDPGSVALHATEAAVLRESLGEGEAACHAFNGNLRRSIPTPFTQAAYRETSMTPSLMKRSMIVKLNLSIAFYESQKSFHMMNW